MRERERICFSFSKQKPSWYSYKPNNPTFTLCLPMQIEQRGKPPISKLNPQLLYIPCYWRWETLMLLLTTKLLQVPEVLIHPIQTNHPTFFTLCLPPNANRTRSTSKEATEPPISNANPQRLACLAIYVIANSDGFYSHLLRYYKFLKWSSRRDSIVRWIAGSGRSGRRGRKEEAIRREQELLWTRLTFATRRDTSPSVHAAALRSTWSLDFGSPGSVRIVDTWGRRPLQ